MRFFSTRYRSGEEIRAGDRITWAGKPGRVLFVLGRPEVVEGWRDLMAHLSETERQGFAVETELAGVVFEPEADEDLEFCGRDAP
ncbi:MAG: hypothetical protein ACT4QC_04835 [Planctomycetaceae bacterium]